MNQPYKKSESMSPLETPCHNLPINQYTSYFSLGNTINNETRINYTDKLSNFVHRFSRQLNVNGNEKNWIKQKTNRFSLEETHKVYHNYKHMKKDEKSNK